MSLPDELLNRYLVFSLGRESFAVPLMQVREVVRSPRLCSVPGTVRWHKGIANIRGRMVSVVDLRQHYGFSTASSGRGGVEGCVALLIQCGSSGNLIGAIVDELVGVKEFLPEAIHSHPGIQTRIEPKHLIGISPSGDDLVHLIDLSALLSGQDYQTASKEAA